MFRQIDPEPSAVFVVAAAPAQPIAAPSDQMAIQGPWAYGDSGKGQGRSKTRIEMTRAAESDHVWFGFSCSSDSRKFASIPDQDGFGRSAGDDVAIGIELSNVAHLRTPAKKASHTIAA